MFERTLYARWGDMDFNGHMRNTAFLDAAADVRMMFFASNGFPMSEFEKRRIGPVILRDELDYFRELRLLQPVRVTLETSGLSEDGTRFRLVNQFFREDGVRAVRVTSTGGWLDLDGTAHAARADRPDRAVRSSVVAVGTETLIWPKADEGLSRSLTKC
jgi:acyl-CoA thioester hydrolase